MKLIYGIGQQISNQIDQQKRRKIKKVMRKSVSNLDLKLLDVRFMAIDDNQIYLTQALQSVKKSRNNYELPSLLNRQRNSIDSILNETYNRSVVDSTFVSARLKNRETQQTNDQSQFSILGCLNSKQMTNIKQGTIYNNQNQNIIQQNIQDQLQQIKQQIKLKRKPSSINYQQSKHSQFHQQKNQQQLQLERYRKKIQQVKRQNSQIHTHISQLYKLKINQHKEHFKKVSSIQPYRLQHSKHQNNFNNKQKSQLLSSISSQNLRANRLIQSQKLTSSVINRAQPSLTFIKQQSSVKLRKQSIKQKKELSPLMLQKMNFYEKLNSNSPYKQQLQDIHKKMISNNFHKNFQQYLVNANRRVPQFIKSLKS